MFIMTLHGDLHRLTPMCHCFCVPPHLLLILCTRAVQGLWWKRLEVTVTTCLFRPESTQFFKLIAWLALNCLNKWKLNRYFLYYTAKSTKTIKFPSWFFPGCLHLVQKGEWHSSYPFFLLKFDFAANFTVNFIFNILFLILFLTYCYCVY